MERSLHFVKGAVWRIWNTYFQNLDKPTPSLHFLKVGSAENEGFFITPVSEQVVKDFLAANRSHLEISFSEASYWAVNEWDWFGEWSVFVGRPAVVTYNTQRTGKRR